MHKTNSAKMSMEVKVEVLGANLKSLGRSFDTYKDNLGGKLDHMHEDIVDLNKALVKHTEWEEDYHEKDTAKNDKLFDKMQEYIDARHEAAMDQGLKAEKKIDNFIRSVAGGLMVILISVLGYMWTAKQNEDNLEKAKIEQLEKDINDKK